MTTNRDIDVCSYSGDIHAIITRSGLAGDVEFVPIIQEWCAKHGVAEDNPWRLGKIVQNKESGRYLILLPERITGEMASSVISGIQARGLVSDAGQLSDPLAFVRHLVLHEIAHGLDSTRSETECDKWAFQQLCELPSDTTLAQETRKSSARPSL